MLNSSKWIALVFIGLVILSSGCSMPSNKGAYFSGVEREEGLATIYIYRMEQYGGSARSVQVMNHDKKIGPALSINGYIKYLTEPGLHGIYIDTESADSIREIDAKPNETYFLRAEFKMYHSFMRVMNEEEAIEELKTRQLELPLETATK